MRIAAALASSLVCASVLAACAQSAPVRRDVVLGIVGEPASVFGDDGGARVLRGALVETLVRRDPRDELVPRLAAEVPTLENGGLRIVTDDRAAPAGRLVATFRLRDGLRWHDGEPITADDVRFAWEQDRQLPLDSPARWIADRVADVVVVDARTVRVSYRGGERWDDYALAPQVMPRHVLSGASAQARAAYDREPVHAGPFTVAAWLSGFGVTLTAYKGYVGGPPALGRIEVRFLSSSAAVLDALRRGDIDVAPYPAVDADQVRTLDRFADGTRLLTYYTPSESLEVLRFGAAPSRFGDVALRKAVSLAVDRSSIVGDLFAGRARVPRGYLVAPLWAAEEADTPIGVDREAARALLAAAGFRRGQFGILERAGERMTATLLVAAGSNARTDAARRVAGDLAAVGIAAEVRERALADLRLVVARGDFDLALLPESADDPQRAADGWHGLAGPWFDLLADAAQVAPTRAEKRPLYAEMQRIWNQALPGLPLYQRLQVDVAPRALAGVQPSPQGGPLTWNAREWAFADVR